MRRMKGLENMICNEKVKEFDLFSLSKRKLKCNLI